VESGGNGRPEEWLPSATLTALKQRAEVLGQIRRFFARRGVLEVETPCLSRAGTPDPNLHSFVVTESSRAGADFYLHTSPEFPMKRLLAAGSGPIFQLAKVFREGEQGCWHNPEFTLLEWYRPGFDHLRLMEEVEEFLVEVLGSRPCQRLSYREAFQEYAGLDPHRATLAGLRAQVERLGLDFTGTGSEDEGAYLDLILSHRVAPRLGLDRPIFLHDFPPSQAALARIRDGDPPVAERFELFIQGVEIANGFHELTDPLEQRARFTAENAKRRARGLPCIPIDERFLDALAQGLPDCAGVALGFDRLLMAFLGASDIAEVLAFPFDRA
jgi:lysyl-tRNA synthetase class 2